jgi:hypothetical protein
VERSKGFNRFLTKDELYESGYETVPFGFCAKVGYSFSPAPSQKNEKANHGYTLDMPDYSVFYAVKGLGMRRGRTVKGGSLLDIASLVARRLGLE